VLFIGDDWAEAHHDIEIEDESGRVLARRRLPEGLAGMTTLHELAAEHLDPAVEPDQVQVGVEADRGPWVQALLAAGYVVFAINPAALAAFGTDLAGRDALAVLTAAPNPDLGRRLSLSRIETLLRRAGRQRNVSATAATIRAALTSEQLGCSSRCGTCLCGQRVGADRCAGGDGGPDRGACRAGGAGFWPAPGR
jgi:Transposase